MAHQFLTKPCDADLLENVIDRACQLQNLVSDEGLLGTIGNIKTLPPLPDMYRALTKALMDPDTGADEISEILEQDMAMSAKILQLVNSSFFAGAMTISNIQFAAVRLGFQMIKNLAMSLEVFKTTGLSNISGFSPELLQSHSLLVANIARRLLEDKQQSEDAFMAGMLSNIGLLIMAKEFPENLRSAIAVANEEAVLLHVVEEQCYGVTHAEIGAYLLGVWGLPYPIVEAVANHHKPDRVPAHGFGILEAVHVAEGLVSELIDDSLMYSSLDFSHLEQLGVRNQLEKWCTISQECLSASMKGASR